jgi:hypothetical protein
MDDFLKKLLELCNEHNVDLTSCYSTDRVVATGVHEQTEFEIRDGELEQ